MNENLLTRPPECHRELFDNGKAKDTYTLRDFLDYYAVSFYPASLYGNYTTVAYVERLRETAIAEAPQLSEEELSKLKNLIQKHSLEVVLYALDLVDCDNYPEVELIKNNISDGSNVLANLVRNRDYGV